MINSKLCNITSADTYIGIPAKKNKIKMKKTIIIAEAGVNHKHWLTK
jgi:hypothetical protein